MERDKEAVAAYDQVISISDQWFGTWSNRALSLIELNKLDEALSSVNRALDLTPQTQASFHPLLVRGKVLYLLLKYEDAAQDIISAWEIDPDTVLSSEEYRSIFTDLFTALTAPSLKAKKLQEAILSSPDL